VLLAVFTVWVLTDTSKEWFRNVFLVGIIPAVMVYWIRKNVPEPEQWTNAQSKEKPRIGELFTGNTRRITLLTIVVCACSLTAWWAFMFWIIRFVRELPEIARWSPGDRQRLSSVAFFLLVGVSIGGNFFGGWLAKLMGYRNAILAMLAGFFTAMVASFAVPRGHVSLMFCTSIVGFFSGVFGLFTMYLPPLFPTLLRTTGAGFSYNIGRIAAAGGTIFFGIYGHVDLRHALLVNSFLIIPAAIAAIFLPNTRDV
jgi:Na+/melibiose symporter-like transporter